jgi:hypothetical protein
MNKKEKRERAFHIRLLKRHPCYDCGREIGTLNIYNYALCDECIEKRCSNTQDTFNVNRIAKRLAKNFKIPFIMLPILTNHVVMTTMNFQHHSSYTNNQITEDLIYSLASCCLRKKHKKTNKQIIEQLKSWGFCYEK